MNYTQAQIDRANAVSLEDFLRTQGETLIKSGREYRWKEHDSLTVRGNKWFRHSQSKGGYPIDFVMEFYGKSFPEAVQLLTGESAEGQSEASTAPPTAFHLPLHNRTADRAIQYLTESRGGCCTRKKSKCSSLFTVKCLQKRKNARHRPPNFQKADNSNRPF